MKNLQEQVVQSEEDIHAAIAAGESELLFTIHYSLFTIAIAIAAGESELCRVSMTIGY